MTSSIRLLGPVGVVWAVMLALAGCSGPRLVPVSGSVVWEDGTPAVELADGSVTFESVGSERRISCVGTIDKSGQFTMMTNAPGDGVPPGEYRVVVTEPVADVDVAPKPILDPRFLKFETSGLTVTITNQPRRDLTLKVARIGR